MSSVADNNTAKQMAQQNRQELGELWIPTNPDERILISTASHYSDVHPDVFESTYREFAGALLRPDPHNHEKAGSLYLNGPCYGRKSKSNIPFLRFAVLDADKSYNKDMVEQDGAPDPENVHKILRSLGITHIIHTTYSHGGEKGNRYRIVFPTYCETAAELRSVVTCMSEMIQTHGEPTFVLSGESTRWGQMWQFPRTATEKSPFYSAVYWGHTLNAALIERHYDFSNELANRLPPQEYKTQVDYYTMWGQAERYLPIPKQLLEAGYTFCYQGTQTLQDGKQTLVQRWAKPGESTSNPGIVVFTLGARTYVYSHYSTDPLAVGRALGAEECFTHLHGLQGEPKSVVLGLVSARIQDEIAEEMNHRYPSIIVSGSDFKIGNIFEEETSGLTYKYMSFANFTLSQANEPPVWVMDTKKDSDNPTLTSIDRATFWSKCRNRKVYNGIRYQPCPITKQPQREIDGDGESGTYFNIFNGWHVKPAKGCWSMLEWHLKNSICGGVEEEYEYLLDWFAHMVQQPAKKPGVALVLKGGKGWGKSEVFSRLISCFGVNSMVVMNDRQLTGSFNSHLQNKIAVMVEESFYSGDPKAEGVLKTLITDKDTTFEAKRENAVKGRSYVRVILVTNNDWVAPVTGDERRFFIPSMSSASADLNREEADPDKTFFSSLFREMENGGVEAFYYDMAKRDISKRNIHIPPVTNELSRQREQTFVKDMAWLYDVLSLGEIRVKDNIPYTFSETGITLPINELEQSLSPYLSQYERQKSLYSRMRTLLEKTLPNSHRIVNTSMGAQVKLSSLDKCRAEFQNKSHIKVSWPSIEAMV